MTYSNGGKQMRRMYLLLLGLCLFFFADPKPVYPQGWIPKRIVSMEYPRLAGQARIQGQVQVECAINPDGSVRSTKVSSVSGSANAHPLLAEAAQKNARKWTFMRNSESPTGSSGSGNSGLLVQTRRSRLLQST